VIFVPGSGATTASAPPPRPGRVTCPQGRERHQRRQPSTVARPPSNCSPFSPSEISPIISFDVFFPGRADGDYPFRSFRHFRRAWNRAFGPLASAVDQSFTTRHAGLQSGRTLARVCRLDAGRLARVSTVLSGAGVKGVTALQRLYTLPSAELSARMIDVSPRLLRGSCNCVRLPGDQRRFVRSSGLMVVGRSFQADSRLILDAALGS